jgi:hypothetical protein
MITEKHSPESHGAEGKELGSKAAHSASPAVSKVQPTAVAEGTYDQISLGTYAVLLSGLTLFLAAGLIALVRIIA